MRAADLALRNATYRLFVEKAETPSLSDAAAEAGIAPEEAAEGLRRLHEQHAVVLDRETGEIRMLNPFSAVPTAYRVHAAGRSWYANCAWDAFGVCAALHADGRIETSCPDCAQPTAVDVAGARPDDDGLLFHCLVPAARWWDDIVFT